MSMMKAFLFAIRSSIIFSSNNPEIYNVKGLSIKSKFNPKPTLEHIFPKCYMNKISYNDMHNIFRCNGEINNMRSNYKYTDDWDLRNFTKIHNTGNYISTKDKLFIPEEDSRGIIARTIMYMSYEYKYKYSKVIDTDVLIDWCMSYPPSKMEIHHNNDAFRKQYKRNKFIDLYCKKNYKNYIQQLFNE